MSCNLLTVVLITGVISAGALCAAETPAPAPKPTPATSTPGAQAGASNEKPATAATLEGKPAPVKPLTPARPGFAPPEVQPPVKPGFVRPETPNQNDPLDKPAAGVFKEGPVSRPSTQRGFNNIDPINGRPIGDQQDFIFGLLADPAPSVAVGTGDVVQQPLYLSFSSEDNLKAFQKADKATRQRYIEKARSNHLDGPRGDQNRDDQKPADQKSDNQKPDDQKNDKQKTENQKRDSTEQKR